MAAGRGGAPCRAGCAGRSEGREKHCFESGPGNARGEVKAVMMLMRGRKARRKARGQSAAGKPEDESHKRSKLSKPCCARTVIAERAVAVRVKAPRIPKALRVVAVPRDTHIQAVIKTINRAAPLQKVFIAFVYQANRQVLPAAGYLTGSLTTASGGTGKKHPHEHTAARHTGEVIISY